MSKVHGHCGVGLVAKCIKVLVIDVRHDISADETGIIPLFIVVINISASLPGTMISPVSGLSLDME